MHFNRGGRSGRAPILCLLEKNGGTLSQQELGMFFELKPGSLSEILSKLETAGLIYRTRGQQDRRQLTVTLTEAGAEAARQEAEIRQRFRSNAFSTLTPEEQETLAGLLERVRAHWEGLDG
ncbi:MarR family transcriptional regulator [Collinsella sp. BA40]|nr:MarR family transcriptional regulator [Collinsella sp. D33t1_170424_A12]TXF38298.1 MarR family transcriptional regulator [Collinsella sp. BA40]